MPSFHYSLALVSSLLVKKVCLKLESKLHPSAASSRHSDASSSKQSRRKEKDKNSQIQIKFLDVLDVVEMLSWK